jgi:hypothetical protein
VSRARSISCRPTCASCPATRNPPPRPHPVEGWRTRPLEALPARHRQTHRSKRQPRGHRSPAWCRIRDAYQDTSAPTQPLDSTRTKRHVPRPSCAANNRRLPAFAGAGSVCSTDLGCPVVRSVDRFQLDARHRLLRCALRAAPRVPQRAHALRRRDERNAARWMMLRFGNRSHLRSRARPRAGSPVPRQRMSARLLGEPKRLLLRWSHLRPDEPLVVPGTVGVDASRMSCVE